MYGFLFHSSKLNKNKANGFTIVELIIVIAVIGILAAITFISYSGWTRKIVETQVKNDLNGAAAAMKNAQVFSNSYPASIPATFTPSKGVSLTGGSSDGTTYCLDAMSLQDSSIHYYIDQDSGTSGAQEGLCADRVTKWEQISVGLGITCGLKNGGKVYCWGKNDYGQLGNSTTTFSFSSPVAVDATGLLKNKIVKDIAVGNYGACVITDDNKIYCWGLALGNGSTSNSNTPVAINMSGALIGKTIKSISAGDNFYCVLASDNQVYCWGDNYYGSLGNDSTTDSIYPVKVIFGGQSIKSISTGYYNACAITYNGTAYCWGYNDLGVLGDGTTSHRHTPVAVDMTGALNGLTIKSISSGDMHTCAIASDNRAYCWGYNYSQQLGNTSIPENGSTVPVAVDTSSALNGVNLESISAGNRYTCTVSDLGKAYCWGYNSRGTLGNGSTYNSSPAAVDASGELNGVTLNYVVAGDSHTFALDNAGKAYCWGSNSYGQLGQGYFYGDDALVPMSL